MNRKKAVVLLILFVAMTFLCLLAWINNICIAMEWYKDLRQGELYQMTGKPSSNGANNQTSEEKIYSGPITQFDTISRLDISTVTTFIPFMGCLLITLGYYKILTAKKGSTISKYFPFYRRYIGQTVTLGLIGTVWGIIMLGYYPANKIDMSDMILCLHTSLYSTLVALVWAYFIAIPSEYFMIKWYTTVSEYQIPSIYNMKSYIGIVKKEVMEARQEVSKTVQSFVSLSEKLPDINNAFETAAKSLKDIKEKSDSMFSEQGKLLEDLNDESKMRKESLEKQQQVSNGQIEIIGGIKKELEEERKIRIDTQKQLQESMNSESKAIAAMERAKIFAEQANSERNIAEQKAIDSENQLNAFRDKMKELIKS